MESQRRSYSDCHQEACAYYEATKPVVDQAKQLRTEHFAECEAYRGLKTEYLVACEATRESRESYQELRSSSDNLHDA